MLLKIIIVRHQKIWKSHFAKMVKTPQLANKINGKLLKLRLLMIAIGESVKLSNLKMPIFKVFWPLITKN